VAQPSLSSYDGRGGVRLAYHETGAGRPLILLHGLSADGRMWLANGHAERFAQAGFRVIMPDFRGHGASGKPHDAAAYPADALPDDILALIGHLGLHGHGEYDLAGYSLGARIVVRALVRGATPGRAVVAGQGMQELLGAVGRAGTQLRRIFGGAGTAAPGSPDARAEQWLRSRGADPVALLHVLDTLVPTPAEAIGRIQVPTLVLIGADDERAPTAGMLADALPHATLTRIPGDHGSAAASPELATAMLDFLSAPAAS
jgi:pimeloyl-ACP methyl ester carboxylesterase